MTELPDGWTVRGASLRDIPAILALTRAADLANIGEPDWSTEEVLSTLTAPNHDPALDSWLALDSAGALVAWAYLDNPSGAVQDGVEVYPLPGVGEVAYRPLLERAIARVADRARAWQYPKMVMQAGVVTSEDEYIRQLRAVGFGFGRRHARLRRPLSGDETPPADHRIRPIRAGSEAELRRFHAVLRAAFNTDPDPDRVPPEFVHWRDAVVRPSVCWDEWFVATVDGAIVGALQSSQQGVERDEGWVSNLAVLAEHRGTGIGTALLRTAFAAYATKRRRFVGLGVNVTNPTGAYRLYTALGFEPTFEVDVYTLDVPAADGPRHGWGARRGDQA